MAASIAVLQPAYLGDVVFASPLTRAIAERWPGCALTFVARPPADEIARHLPGVTRVLVFDKRGADRGWAGLRRLGTELAAVRPEIVVALQDSPRTALLASLSGAPVRVGPAESLGAALYSQCEEIEGLPFVDRSCALGRAIGLSPRAELELRLPEALVDRTLPDSSVAVIPGSEWATKRWPFRHVAELGRRLRSQGRTPVLLGSPCERSLCAEANALSGNSFVDLCGNRVEEALGVLAKCVAAVGGDSGLTHAARALGIPVIALFGPTDPTQHHPRVRDRLLSLQLPCSPCSPHGTRHCPLGHHRCLEDLSPSQVQAALSEVC